MQIGTSSGQFSLGISEIVRGDAENFCKIIDSIMGDIQNCYLTMKVLIRSHN